jgi:hypothetical protein
MNDREFCDWSARLAAAAVREKYPHLGHGAVDSAPLGDGVVLFLGNPARPVEYSRRLIAKADREAGAGNSARLGRGGRRWNDRKPDL